ncbi:SCO6745 family protein [Nocardiopsis aegyptia]|uniref:SalK n=1 Tax=Nocardiopsis aegyptia TaxID=220378 RepID=A0A7Z0ES98_9ACTN|nr:hypothetical protein [Nocardiopsis aegyptia]NYJ36972.1 hypothetical protein [Nocardiopsis aegyptia]
MPRIDTVHDEVTPAAARRAWAHVEPYHSMIYFAPEASEAYADLGLKGWAQYFAPRAAALGAASPEVVTAAFFNFHPDAVRSALPGAWEVASPEQVLAARLSAADAALRRILGAAVESPEVERAAELARRAAEAAADDVAGRPLYAAHAALPWPEEPHLVLWHAQTLLREYRGDGHVAALLTAGLSGLDALVTHAAAGEGMPAEKLRTTRKWSQEEWDTAADGLRESGWLAEGPELALTSVGAQRRARIEEITDGLALAPYAVLGTEGCAELAELGRPLAKPLVQELMPWATKRMK